jgi:hypothetical protein
MLRRSVSSPVVKRLTRISPSGPITGATGLTTGLYKSIPLDEDLDGLLSSSTNITRLAIIDKLRRSCLINTNHVAIGLLEG